MHGNVASQISTIAKLAPATADVPLHAIWKQAYCNAFQAFGVSLPPYGSKGVQDGFHAPGWCSFDAGRWLKVLGLEGLESYAPTVVMKFTACVMVWAGVSRVPFSCSAPIVPSTSSCQAKCGCLCTHTARTLPLRPECLDWDQGLVVFVSTACQQA